MVRIVSPVTNRDGVVDAANKGLPLRVLCTKTATPKNGAWSGSWVMYVMHDVNGAPYEELFVHTPQQKPREFKGIYGLLSFALELGFSAPALPLIEGESAEWKRGTRKASDTV